MPREGAIIFRDLVGKLDVLNIECEKCSRRGRYRLDRLVEHKFPHQTAISKPITVILHRTSWERRSTPSLASGVPTTPRLRRPAARSPYFGRYFLFNAQATENCGSTTLAM